MKVFIHPTAEVSKNASIGKGTSVWHHCHIRENVTIGDKCHLGKDVYIDAGVKIGNRVKIQNGVSVYRGVIVEDEAFLGPHMVFTNDLYPRSSIHDFKVYLTVVKKGVSIGANATIICGITLNEYAMIGAGSVVTKNVPKHALVIGNPAKIVGFVCICGQKLKKDKNSLMKCVNCGRKFKIKA